MKLTKFESECRSDRYLEELIVTKREEQKILLHEMSKIEGQGPMSLMMNPSALGDVFSSLKKVAEVNDSLIFELARRALINGN